MRKQNGLRYNGLEIFGYPCDGVTQVWQPFCSNVVERNKIISTKRFFFRIGCVNDDDILYGLYDRIYWLKPADVCDEDLFMFGRDVAEQYDTFTDMFRHLIHKILPAEKLSKIYRKEPVPKNEQLKTIRLLTSAIERKPYNPKLYFERGMIYFDQKDWDHAIEDFQKSLKQTVEEDENYTYYQFWLSKACKEKQSNI